MKYTQLKSTEEKPKVIENLAEKKLIELLGERYVTNNSDREDHSQDFSYHTPQKPDAVAYPKTAEEIQEIVKICAEYRIPIIPYGSGTSLEGHIIPNYGGLSIDFRYMKSVIQIRPDDMDVTVQPGISYEELNVLLKPYGFFFPVDPGPGASIGGMVATSCSGTFAVRYGTMKDNVLALKVVTADGKLVKTRSRAKKSSAGYDLTHLFIGSEGTLGVVTEVTLKMQPLPETKAVSLVTFDDINSASRTVIQTMQSGSHIGRVELLDEVMLKAVNLGSGAQFAEKPTLIFEFTGSQNHVNEQINTVRTISKKNNALDFKFATNEKEREDLWFARKIALWSSKSLAPDSQVWITDVCVPISKLADIIEFTKKDINQTQLYAPLVSHAGDGNFHLFILFDPKNDEQVKQAHFINDNLVKRAIEYEGTCTGEHGVSFGKIKYLESELGPEALGIMKKIKNALDPQNIMNPGKIIDDPNYSGNHHHNH
eukprot:gene453-573_t